MKGIDIFCASQASTAISLSMEEPSSSSSSSSTILLAGGRAIDRHNPIIRDSRRIARSLPPCTTPQSPISPKPHKKKKSHKIPLNENYTEIKKSAEIANSNKPDEETKKKKDTGETNRDGGGAGKNGVTVRKSSWSCTKPGDFISPPGSTRYLLGDKVLLNAVSDFDPNLKLFPEGNSEPVSKVVQAEEPLDGKLSSVSVSPDEVVEPREVVLRVSLHCRGCERKMRKHISRMEGVTSFDIDFMAKKVTVTGNVTPLSVLSSISKVKNAQLWPPTVASSMPSVNLNDSGLIKNEGKGGDPKVGDKEGIFVSMASQI